MFTGAGGMEYGFAVQITIPDAATRAFGLTEAEALVNMACGLYADARASLGHAAELSGLSIPAFMRELARRHIAMNYGVEDFEQDLRNIAELERRAGRQ